jgi:hypothetical protein
MALDRPNPQVSNLAVPVRSEFQSSLQALYKEQCDQARQHETMRQQATTIALTLVGAVVSLAAASGGALAFMRGTGSLPNLSPVFFAIYSLLGFFVIGIGRHGRKLSLKHYERNRFHTEHARAYRKRIEELFPGCNFGDVLRKEAKSAHKKRWEQEIGASLADVIDEHLYILWLDLFGFLYWVGLFMVLVPFAVALLLGARSPTDPAPHAPVPSSLSSEFSPPGCGNEMPHSTQVGLSAPESLHRVGHD